MTSPVPFIRDLAGSAMVIPVKSQSGTLFFLR